MQSKKMAKRRIADCVYHYNGRDVPYSIWTNFESGSVKWVVFLGTVQIGKLAEWVVESVPPGTIVVQGAPHWFAMDNGSDMPDFVFGFTRAAFDDIVKRFQVDKVRVVADSQAAPGVLELFAQGRYSHYLDKLVLLQPVGLNQDAYSGTDEQRMRIFTRRVAANTFYQLMAFVSDARLRYNHAMINKTVNLRSSKARAQYNSGLKYSAVSALRRVYGHNRKITVICGANDKMFPPSEIKVTLAKNGLDIDVQVVNGVPHSPPATKYGNMLLERAWGSR